MKHFKDGTSSGRILLENIQTETNAGEYARFAMPEINTNKDVITMCRRGIQRTFFSKHIQSYLAGDISSALGHYQNFRQVADKFKTTASRHNFMNIAEIKYALYRLKIIRCSNVSPDLVPLSYTDKENLDQTLQSTFK